MRGRSVIVGSLLLLAIVSGRAAGQSTRWMPLWPATGSYISAMAIAPDGTVYAGTWGGLLLTIRDNVIVHTDSIPRGGSVTDILVVSSDEVFVAADGPYRFRPVERVWEGLPITGTTWFARSGDGTIVAAGAYQPYYRSTDGGASWSLIQRDGLPPSDQNLEGVAAGAGGTFYAGYSFFGVWKSTDGGATWLETMFRRTADSLINAPHIITLGDGTILVYGGNGKQPGSPEERGGIYRSTDGGETWAMSRPSPIHGGAIEIIKDMKGSGQHAVAGMGYGRNVVVETTDGGTTWHELVEGITQDTTVQAVAVRGDDAYLSVLGDAGLYRLVSSAGVGSDGVASAGKMMVVPNPAGGETVLRLSVGAPGLVRIDVVDLLGRAVISREAMVDAGVREIRLETAALPPGSYTVTAVERSGRSQRARFIVAR